MTKAPKNKSGKRRAIPPFRAVQHVVRTLQRGGFEALLAGGCVRDKLLGKIPKDYDVATNAVPKEVLRLFPRTLTVGAQFGVVIVLYKGRQIEVATFRSDMNYKDGRRPEKVVFTDARHDALRRDFTINGMFYDLLAGEVIDYVCGKKDLQKNIIRAIGDPLERFSEDHLRMLRAVRFAARLEFKINRKTWQAIMQLAHLLEKISSERIAAELEMILTDPHRGRGARLAFDSGLLKVIFPGVEKEQLLTGMKVLERLPRRCSFDLALAGLLIETDSAQADHLCRSLKLSNRLRKHVKWLLSHRQELLDAIPLSKGNLKSWLNEPLFESLVQLNRSYLRTIGQSESKLRRLRRQINELGVEPIAPAPFLNGHDLINLGATAGPMVGQLAEELYLAQLEDQIKSPAQARTWVKNWLIHHKENN